MRKKFIRFSNIFGECADAREVKNVDSHEQCVHMEWRKVFYRDKYIPGVLAWSSRFWHSCKPSFQAHSRIFFIPEYPCCVAADCIMQWPGCVCPFSTSYRRRSMVSPIVRCERVSRWPGSVKCDLLVTNVLLYPSFSFLPQFMSQLITFSMGWNNRAEIKRQQILAMLIPPC